MKEHILSQEAMIQDLQLKNESLTSDETLKQALVELRSQVSNLLAQNNLLA